MTTEVGCPTIPSLCNFPRRPQRGPRARPPCWKPCLLSTQRSRGWRPCGCSASSPQTLWVHLASRCYHLRASHSLADIRNQMISPGLSRPVPRGAFQWGDPLHVHHGLSGWTSTIKCWDSSQKRGPGNTVHVLGSRRHREQRGHLKVLEPRIVFKWEQWRNYAYLSLYVCLLCYLNKIGHPGNKPGAATCLFLWLNCLFWISETKH